MRIKMDISKKLLHADWAHRRGYTGQGIGIAFLDTGISMVEDFIVPQNRIVAFQDFVGRQQLPYDNNGHGTHVAYGYS